MESINCTIEHITYQNPENGYSVLQATVKGYREPQKKLEIIKSLSEAELLAITPATTIEPSCGSTALW